MGIKISIPESAIPVMIPDNKVSETKTLDETVNDLKESLPEQYDDKHRCINYFNRMQNCTKSGGNCSSYENDFLKCTVIAGLSRDKQ